MFDTMLGTIVDWVGAIVAIVFVVFIIKDIFEIIKGQGSILKCVGKVIFVFIIVGVIFATKNYKTMGEAFADTAETGVTTLGDEAGDLF